MSFQSPRSGAAPAGALLAAAFALAGCAAAPEASPPPAGAARPTTYVYTCPDGYRFSAHFRDDSAVVELPDRSLALPHVLSADGARYQADGVELWTRGLQASLTMDPATYRGCETSSSGRPRG